MSFGYKTILAHFDSTPRAAQRLQVAARLADAHDAHLVAVYSIMSPLYSEPFVADGGAFVAQELLRFQEKKDADARAAFDRLAPAVDALAVAEGPDAPAEGIRVRLRLRGNGTERLRGRLCGTT